jgi:hypothetical protein
MNKIEIEEVCADIACRYDLTYNEYLEVLNASICEAEVIHNYYESKR